MSRCRAKEIPSQTANKEQCTNEWYNDDRKYLTEGMIEFNREDRHGFVK